MGDSGATTTAISTKMANQAQLEYDDLKPPRKIPLASCESTVTLIGVATVKIDIHVGSERTITVRDTPIWILKEDMERYGRSLIG